MGATVGDLAVIMFTAAITITILVTSDAGHAQHYHHRQHCYHPYRQTQYSKSFSEGDSFLNGRTDTTSARVENARSTHVAHT